MADIATLGLRLDANGFIADANRASDAVNKLGTTSNQSTAHFGRMRGALTQVALAASGVPGPVGRLASVMGQFALGGGLTVGVLAGIAAISVAWEKWTEGARKARDMMRELGRDALKFSPGSMEARVGIFSQQESRLTAQLADVQSRRGSSFLREGPIGLALNIMEQERLSTELNETRDLIAEMNSAIAKFTRDLQDEAADAVSGKKNRIAVAYQQRGAGLGRVTQWWNPYATIGAEKTAADSQAELTYKEGAKAAQRMYGAAPEMLSAKLKILGVERDIAKAIAQQAADYDATLIKAQQKAGAQQHLANYGIGLAASAAGPFGGMVSGIGAGLMSGNPWMAAASGITGLVDGLFSLGSSSAQARAALRAFQMQLEEWLDSADLKLGHISQKDFDVKQIQRDAEAERQALKSHYPGVQGTGLLFGRQRDEYQAALDKINQKERELIEQRQKEADAIDSLTTAVRNGPTGFFVESYLQRIGAGGSGTGAGWEGQSPVSGQTTFNVVIPEHGITIDGNGTPLEMAQQFVLGMQQWASASGGTGMSMSDAMARMPVS